MTGTKNPIVKICCISSTVEALLAVQYGALALGLVSKMPSGPGVIDDEMIIDILKTIPPNIKSFLLTSMTESSEIISQHKKLKTTTIQIVDEVKTEVYKNLKEEFPETQIVQVVHVTDESSIDYALRVSAYADALLLDSGKPNLKIKELGGTGRVHNWQISRRIRAEANIPVYLAGGLTPENVRRAIETVEPFGVDLCNGVRTDGLLNEKKLEDFFKEVK